MAFNGSEGGQITLAEGRAFADNNQALSGDINSHFFGKDILHKLLNQDGCMGIRIYYGKDGNGAKNLVLVGADSNEDDMIDGIIADRSVPCPPSCPNGKKLKG